MSTEDWSKQLITRSGCLFDVRPAHPGDRQQLSEFLAHVAPEDKAFRAKTGHNADIRIINPDHHPGKTFLAFVGQEAEVIAAATLDCDPERNLGDVSLIIRSDFKHDGVSWELLSHVIRYAEAIGVKAIEFVEVRENHAALALETDMGFTQQDHPSNPALIVMRKKLGHTPRE